MRNWYWIFRKFEEPETLCGITALIVENECHSRRATDRNAVWDHATVFCCNDRDVDVFTAMDAAKMAVRRHGVDWPFNK